MSVDTLISDRERLAKKYKYGSSAEDKGGQTSQVFESNVDFNAHKWIQRGPYIYDSCTNCIEQAVFIGNKSLTKRSGKYAIISVEDDVKHRS